MLNLVLLIFCYGLSSVSCHTQGTDYIYYFDAYMPAGTTKCGPQTLTGWTVKYDRFRDATGAGPATDNTYFSASTGIFSAPPTLRNGNSANALYHCCASARCKKGGVCDFTIVDETGEVRAAFGNRLSPAEWSSHSTCFVNRMKQGKTLKVVLQSGGGNDCLEETGWYYNRFTCHLVSMA